MSAGLTFFKLVGWTAHRARTQLAYPNRRGTEMNGAVASCLRQFPPFNVMFQFRVVCGLQAVVLAAASSIELVVVRALVPLVDK
jgi:hypothetical protein